MDRIKSKILTLIMAIVVALSFTACIRIVPAETTTSKSTQKETTVTSASAEETTTTTTSEATSDTTTTAEDKIAYGEYYYSKDEVALYIHTYNELPGNFITKKDAKALGWTGGSLEPYAPGKTIGGDRFGNYEHVLPDGDYHECDIDTLGKSKRGSKRIVYDSDGDIYYTDDHYQTFTELY